MITTTLAILASLAIQTTPGQDLNIQQKLDAARHTYTAPKVQLMTAEKAQALSIDLTEQSGGRLEVTPSVDSATDILFRGETDRSAMLHVDKNTGGFVFSRGFDGMRDDNGTPGLPAKNTSVQVAVNLLNDLGLMPAGFGQSVVVEHVGGVNMGVHNEDGTTEDFEKLRTVRFARVQDGLKVEGRGSRLVVNLAEQGRLFGLVHRWQPFQGRALTAAEKLTVDEVREQAARQIRIASGDAKQATLESIELVLFDDGQGNMEPALHIVTQMTYASKEIDVTGAEIDRDVTNPFDFFIPVLRDSKANFPHTKDLAQRKVAQPMMDR
ncbi:MAG: hypothetical protein RL885_06365 [Planctomycetota bacterium]